MYLVTSGSLAWWAMEGASCGWRGRTRRRGVVKIGAGRGRESMLGLVLGWDAAVVAASAGWGGGGACDDSCAAIMAGWPGVGCAAMVVVVAAVMKDNPPYLYLILFPQHSCQHSRDEIPHL